MATARAATVAAVWKTSGLIKGIGIPAPSGPYEVGCHHLMHDGLFMRLYYPTTPTLGPSTSQQYSKIVFHSKYWKAMLDYYEFKLSGLIAGVLGLFTNTRIPAKLDTPLYNESQTDTQTSPQVSFPVLVFSHGLGSSFFAYSAICCDIASHGFVVAAIEHKDQSACIALKRVPEGRGTSEGRYIDEWIPYLKLVGERISYRKTQVKQRSAEVRQALDILHLLNSGGENIVNMLHNEERFNYSQFKDRLCVESAAVAGHSFGGATCLQALSEDERFKCGIILDVYMYPLNSEVYENGIRQPIIFINSFTYQWKENVINILKLVKPVQETGAKTHLLYTLRGTNHMSQSDAPFIIPRGVFKYATESELPSEIAHAVNIDLCVAFLKRFLLQSEDYQGVVPLLDGGDGASEHVLFGTNVELEDTTHEGQEVSEGERQQEVSDGGRQQEVSEGERQQEVSEGGRQQEVSEGERQQEVSEGGRQEEVSEGERQQEVSEGGRQEEVSEGGRQEEVSEGGRQQEVSEGERQQEVSEGERQQEVSEGERQQEVSERGRQQEVSEGGRQQEVSEGERQQEVSEGERQQEVSEVEHQQEVSEGERQQEVKEE